jgi:hypothetical protein
LVQNVREIENEEVKSHAAQGGCNYCATVGSSCMKGRLQSENRKIELTVLNTTLRRARRVNRNPSECDIPLISSEYPDDINKWSAAIEVAKEKNSTYPEKSVSQTLFLNVFFFFPNHAF